MSNKSSNAEVVLCYPGETSWELWSNGGKGATLYHDSSSKSQAESPMAFKGVTHYAFPVTSALCSPFWAASEDDSLLPDIVEMRLETQSIKPNSGLGQHYDFTALDRDENRTLLQPIMLPDGKPVELPKGDVEVFDISPNFLPLPRNHLVIWRELERWVAVATRKGQPAYFQALNSDAINEEAVLELKCLLLQLHSQGVIEELAGIVVWTRDLSEEGRQRMEEELEMSVLSEERPHPLLPEEPLELLPSDVAAHRKTAAKRQKIRNWISAAALLYLLAVVGLGVNYFLKQRQVENLEASAQKLRKDVGWIEPTASRWNSLEDSYSVERFPIELLYRVLQEVPDRGIRLLDIDINGDRILLKAEATNRNLANRFVSDVKGNKTLEDYEWDHPPYKMDKSGIVTLELKGKYIYGTT
jgi:hypothetical protein